MNKVLPFVFPLIALVIVAFLAFRWYNLNTTSNGDVTGAGEGVPIDDLSSLEQEQILKGTTDFTSVPLEPAVTTVPVAGQIRYDIIDGRVLFSVTAELAAVGGSKYQVWLRNPVTDVTQKAFVLEPGKGGFMGSAATQEGLLPLEVIVSQEQVDDAQLEVVLLRGTMVKGE